MPDRAGAPSAGTPVTGGDGRLRVAHVTEAPLGGVLSYLQEVVAHQAADARFASVHVVVPEVNVEHLAPLGGGKVEVVGVACTRGSTAGLLRLSSATRRLLRRARPDILHVHSTFAGVVARGCALTLRHAPKVVYCPHGWAFSREGNRIKSGLVVAMERALSLVSDRIVCVSQAEKEEAVSAGIPEQRCVVIENGIRLFETGSFPGTAANDAGLPGDAGRPGDAKPSVLFVGRFDRQKGFDLFLELMERLGDDAEGRAVGDYVVGAAKPMAPPGNVSLLGWRPRDEVRGFYGDADLLVMPSRWEGLPIVALEAMAAGLPVFASRAGGLRDLVVDGVTGRLFDVGDVRGMAEAIRTTDRRTLRAYGEQGRLRFIERHTAEVMNRRVMDLYLSVLERPAGAVDALGPALSDAD